LGRGVFDQCSPVYFVDAHRIASNPQIEGIIGIGTRRASNRINLIQTTPRDCVYMKFAILAHVLPERFASVTKIRNSVKALRNV